MSRYNQILTVIDEIKPKKIIEIGTWNGMRAIQLIKHASRWNDKIEYIGYDLFEDATGETDKQEFNVKPHNKFENVLKFIKDHVPKESRISLVKGNTRETLKYQTADLVWLDGGHSIETIRNDFNVLRDCRCVLLDDYYTGAKIDIKKFGCNFIKDDVGGKVLPLKDGVHGGGFVQILRIDNENSANNRN